MGSEYFINSQELENKVRNLLPSQGGAGAGFDLSASTQIIPIIDLTESAEGSNVRADLQTSLSYSTSTTFDVTDTTTTIINNTGYYRVFGSCNFFATSGSVVGSFILNDGSTDKTILSYFTNASSSAGLCNQFDFNVFLGAGDSLKVLAFSTNTIFRGTTRQIADINGNLVNP